MLNAIEEFIMVNPINDSANLKPIEIDSRAKPNNKEAKAAVAEHVSSSDEVSISGASKQLEALKASFKDMPEVDSIRVSQLKSQIESGNYQINSANIAKKMLNQVELA